MAQTKAMGIALAAGAVFCGLGWVSLPMLQGSRAGVSAQVSEHVERARRIFAEYSAGLTYKDILLDDLRSLDVDVDGEDVQLLADDYADEFQEYHAAKWAQYEPTDWDNQPRPARARYGNLSGMIRDGVRSRRELINHNNQLLDQALTEVDAALAVTDGEASGATDALANQLKGIVVYHMALTDALRTRKVLARAEPLRTELGQLAGEIANLKALAMLAQNSHVDAQIASLREKATNLEKSRDTEKAELASLESRIADFERKYADAKTRASNAADAMAALKTRGMDLTADDGAEQFGTEMDTLDRAFRSARREAHDLLWGSYPKAQIDMSADYVRGRYLENGRADNVTITFGLNHFRDERAVAITRVAGLEKSFTILRGHLSRFESNKAGLVHQQTTAAKQQKEIRETALAVLDDLTATMEEANVIEERALRRLDQAARLAQQAARAFGDRVREASDATQGMPPETVARSAFGEGSDDTWMSGFAAVEVADARLARAWVYYHRFNSAKRNAEVYEQVAGALGLDDANADDELDTAQAAQEAGIKEIETALQRLERAHRDVGRHWTLVAQQAGMTYLLALFGDESYVDDAIEGYRNAIKGREDQPYSRVFATRLKKLENRRAMAGG